LAKDAAAVEDTQERVTTGTEGTVAAVVLVVLVAVTELVIETEIGWRTGIMTVGAIEDMIDVTMIDIGGITTIVEIEGRDHQMYAEVGINKDVVI
jgi:hypothetical protein